MEAVLDRGGLVVSKVTDELRQMAKRVARRQGRGMYEGDQVILKPRQEMAVSILLYAARMCHTFSQP